MRLRFTLFDTIVGFAVVCSSIALRVLGHGDAALIVDGLCFLGMLHAFVEVDA